MQGPPDSDDIYDMAMLRPSEPKDYLLPHEQSVMRPQLLADIAEAQALTLPDPCAAYEHRNQ